MKNVIRGGLLSFAVLPALSSATPTSTTSAAAACISSGNQNTINQLFSSGGANTVVQLCKNAVIQITDKISFTAEGQEFSTQGYPTDGTRGLVQVAPGSGASTLIDGQNWSNTKIRNVQFDGNRPNAGYLNNGDANIIMGGVASGQLVEYVVSKNTRSWSCLHVIGSGITSNPCKNATIQYNDIGPCGQSGTDSSGNGLWADGLSIDCTDSLIAGNTVDGPTDGGIVIFGSPGTTVHANTIVSSSEYLSFGGINMVDGEYDGSYDGVTVSDNVITGDLILDIGIAIGSYVWSDNQPYLLEGPATVTGNVLNGNIVWPIAINGWSNGLTVTNNTYDGITTDKSSFSDGSKCDSAIQALFSAEAILSHYPGGVTGPVTLQADFIAADANATNFLCPTTPLPSQVTYALSGLDVVSDSPAFGDLDGVVAQFQGDSNIVVLQNNVPVWASGDTLSQGCGTPTQCKLEFGGDGNMVRYYQNQATWSTGTSGKGHTLVVKNAAPWIEILDVNGNVIWNTTMN